ncbi:hypothetical protein [Clostridium lacusfryxellense]|uniref:hypothetical protein n=1 Tax=Clostridium lacusfryxellense TaxID=205328 RepID=UPI001C0E5454|nr:hypothetical protein [Clostridium lacusfryxellense]MBU3114525.1 hypothetical protein [Clostridium lacusfryxellense]
MRFRVRGLIVECSVPTWSGLSDLLENIEEVTLVVIKNSDTDLSWVFVRGTGRIIENQEWEALVPSEHGLVEPEDIYYLLSIEPKRIELFDEQRGWGFRETADL